eukprot:1653533-Pleurochrysis_carterae.AAC.1
MLDSPSTVEGMIEACGGAGPPTCLCARRRLVDGAGGATRGPVGTGAHRRARHFARCVRWPCGCKCPL